MLDVLEKILTDAQRFGLTPSVDPVAESLQALERMTGITVTSDTQPIGVETPVMLAEPEKEQESEREDGDEWAIFGGTANVADPRDMARHPMRPVPLPKYDKSADLPGGVDDKYVKTDGNDTTSGYLTEKLLVTTDAGITAADAWITGKVLPAGAANNALYLNHQTPQAEDRTITFAGDGTYISGGGTVEFDAKGHERDATKTITLTGASPESSSVLGNCFPVDLTKTSGSQGTSSAAASWVYTVDDINGNELATGVNPVNSPHNFTRPTIGQMRIATAGIAHYESGPTLVVDWVNEVFEREACA